MGAILNHLRKHGQRFFAISLRLLSVLQLLTGLGFIGFSCYLHFPPEDSLTLGLIVIGALAVATAVFGFIVSCARGCCLTVYLTLGVMVTLAQVGFTLYLFIAPQNAVDKLVQQKGDKIDEDKFHTAVYTGRWVFLGVIAVQVLAMVVAIVFRTISNKDQYKSFEEEESENRKADADQQMAQLKEKIMGVEAANRTSPSKAAYLKTATGVSAAAGQRSLFHSDIDDAKLDSDLESGTIPALPAANSHSAWSSSPRPGAAAWPAAQQPQQQRSFKPSWSKAGQDVL